ncbi:MAG TPA: hypothetical protein VGE69_01605, partial [Pseudomonadales bacterium]
MQDNFKISDIFDKNINFLIGSGASYGLLPTLALKILDAEGHSQTIESLSTHFDNSGKSGLKALLFMHYFLTCIKPAIEMNYDALVAPAQTNVLTNYTSFLGTILQMLKRRSGQQNKCNIFTTNYDGCLENAADSLLKRNSDDFILNDGTRGFLKLFLHAKNYDLCVQKTGILEKNIIGIPQI